MGFSRQECWSGLPCPSSRGSSQLRDRTLISCIAGEDKSLSELPQHYFGKWYSFACLLGYCFLTTQTSFEKCWESFKPQQEKLPCWKGLSFEIGFYGLNTFQLHHIFGLWYLVAWSLILITWHAKQRKREYFKQVKRHHGTCREWLNTIKVIPGLMQYCLRNLTMENFGAVTTPGVKIICRTSCTSLLKTLFRRREGQPTPVFVPGKAQGQRSLEGYSPWTAKEPGMT